MALGAAARRSPSGNRLVRTRNLPHARGHPLRLRRAKSQWLSSIWREVSRVQAMHSRRGWGDYRTITLAPKDVAEAVDHTQLLFHLADLYRSPTITLR